MRLVRHCQKESREQERKECARFRITYLAPEQRTPQTIYFYGRLRQVTEWREANPTFKKLSSGLCKHLCAECGEWHRGEAWQ